jgi:pyruvate dehydrogenase E1 component beta subunit
MPSGPYEAKGLLLSAVDDDNVVVVVNNKVCLGLSGPVPEDPYRIPLGEAHVVREGDDVTVVALGRMVSEAVKAADAVAGDGISVEIVDPRTLSPLDITTIVASVRKTNRCVVAQEAVRFGGFGAEIAAQVQEDAFDHLDAPVGRVGAPFSPVPFSPALEKHWVPGAEGIIAEIRKTVGR